MTEYNYIELLVSQQRQQLFDSADRNGIIVLRQHHPTYVEKAWIAAEAKYT